MRGYDLACELATKFGIVHGLLAPPREFAADRNFLATRLNMNSTTSAPSAPHPDKKRKPTIRFTEGKPVIVQPIRLAPAEAVFFGCDRKYEAGLGADKLKEDIANGTERLPPEQLQLFEKRLVSNLKATLRMLNSKEGHCMQAQFQIFVDTNTGKFQHLDTERCFDGNEDRMPDTGWVGRCQAKLEGYLNLLLRSKGGTKLPHLPRIKGAREWQAKLNRTSTARGT